MAKGERVHDPSAVRGRLSERKGSGGGEAGGWPEEEVTSSLTKREQEKGRGKENERKRKKETERGRVRELLPGGINTERWSRVQ